MLWSKIFQVRGYRTLENIFKNRMAKKDVAKKITLELPA